MADLISDLYRQNEWANLETIRLCGELSEEQLRTSTVGTYGNIITTLAHIVGAETGYAYRLGATGINRLRQGDPWPGFDGLAALVRRTTDAFIAAAKGITDTPIQVGGDGEEPWLADPSVILVQVLNHSTEHRSQIFSMLTALGKEPPELSGWEWGSAVGKMRPAGGTAG